MGIDLNLLGRSWELLTAPDRTWAGVGYGDGVLIILEYGLGLVHGLYSEDRGKTWTEVDNVPQNVCVRFAYCEGVFVSPSPWIPNVLRSEDKGRTWESVSNGTDPADPSIIGAATGGGVCVCVGQSGMSIHSEDKGKTWTPVLIKANFSFADIAFGDGVFISPANTNDGDGDYIARSSTYGQSWSRITYSMTELNFWVAVAFGGGVFVILSSGKVIIWSDDTGLKWNRAYAPPEVVTLSAVVFLNGIFIAAASNADNRRILIASYDLGRTWSFLRLFPEYDNEWVGAAVGMDTIVLAASSGVHRIARSSAITSEEGVVQADKINVPVVAGGTYA